MNSPHASSNPIYLWLVRDAFSQYHSTPSLIFLRMTTSSYRFSTSSPSDEEQPPRERERTRVASAFKKNIPTTNRYGHLQLKHLFHFQNTLIYQKPRGRKQLPNSFHRSHDFRGGAYYLKLHVLLLFVLRWRTTARESTLPQRIRNTFPLPITTGAPPETTITRLQGRGLLPQITRSPPIRPQMNDCQRTRPQHIRNTFPLPITTGAPPETTITFHHRSLDFNVRPWVIFCFDLSS